MVVWIAQKLTFEPFSVIVRFEVLEEQHSVRMNRSIRVGSVSWRSRLWLLDDDLGSRSKSSADTLTPKLFALLA